MMDSKDAINAFSALAQDTRLQVFQTLVKEGQDGLPAGEIADRVGVAPSTLSFHLGQLERAGLLRSWRDQRRIFYAPNVEGIKGLLLFMTEDCCQGNPDICGLNGDNISLEKAC